LRRGLKISVVGVPKTIDNDLMFIGRSFGFETSVSAAADVIRSAHVEAKGTPHGIGLVKLMGRDSGFIAAAASMANPVVNFCLVPEVQFELDGENGLLAALERRFAAGKSHAVVVVAEGAGQELLEGAEETVRMLATRYKVVIATKGDLGEQNRKFRQSGLADCVCAVEVMEKKSEADYRNLAAKMGVPTDQFLMVGNAVRSDIAPVIAIGGWAIHIPFRITWAHELMPLPVSDRVLTLTHITQLQPLFL